MRFLFLLALLVGCPSRAVDKPVAPAASPVKLVVLVVVDQLPSWVFRRDLPHFRHGIARLHREGGTAIAAELPYANPFTAPGHATIGTGTTPSVHGVIGNTWYRRSDGRERPAEFDPDGEVFQIATPHDDELSPEDAASGRALRVEGIADALRRYSGGKARSVAIAAKPRAAAFMIGRRPDLAIWYEAGAGGMTTTKAYVAAPPAWLVDSAQRRPVRRFFDRTWQADPRLGAITNVPDGGAGEGSIHGLDPEFPHELGKSERPARAFLHTSFADVLVFDTALAAIDGMQLGADAQPDLLALGFNAHDYAGHLWGPDSWEALQVVLDLDVALGAFFDELDRRFGPAGWAVVLASDHGMTPLVERSPHEGARRVALAEIARVAEAAAVRVLGEGPWIAQVIASNIYLASAFAKLPADQQRAALDAIAHALEQLPGVARAGSTASAKTLCGSSIVLDRAICRSIADGESGELYVLPVAGALLTDYTTGSHHDAPFDDNRRVPILVRAPGLQRTEARSASLLQIAPTLAALLGIPPPAAATASPLFGLSAR